MVTKRNHLLTDSVREIWKTRNRFFSILVLTALAVAFFAGLRTAAPDMEYTADRYYDRTHLMDGYVLSTMGLTEEDLTALSQGAGVDQVEGIWALDATAKDAVVTVRSMPQRLNLLEVQEGRLPERAEECVTESMLLADLGLSIGDTITLAPDPDQADSLLRTTYTIVGVVDSPLYVGVERGSSTLGSGALDAFVYIPGENFNMEVYTQAYLTFQGLAALESYSDAYDQQLDQALEGLEGLAEERAALRDAEIRGEAQDTIDQAQAELDEARAQADQELGDAWKALEDARAELDQGWQDYENGKTTLEESVAQAQKKLEDTSAQLNQSQAEVDAGKSSYNAGLKEYQTALAAYEEQKQALDAQQAQLDEGWAAYQGALDALSGSEGTPEYQQAMAQLEAQRAQLEAAQFQLDEGYGQLAEGKGQLNQTQATLDATAQQLQSAQQAIDSGWSAYNQGVAQLEEQRTQGQQELEQARVKLEQGEADYQAGYDEYQAGKAEAEEQLADGEAELAQARADLDALEPCTWYVLGRDTNVGIVSYSQDAQRVGNLANVFPIIFFLVAALACLTTMTRMVEEQRTQIGGLKAMGFSRWAISQKYLGYALGASLLGGLVGLLIGCTLFPSVIANAFRIMYALPPLEFKFQPLVCGIAVLAAVACTTGAALAACGSTLVDSPANLLRPKAPKAGKRVLLERIDVIWKHLSFTRKVTVRNLFRYKRRFWMTVIGIGGCTALIVTGIGLHDSIYAVLDHQFDEITQYDALVGTKESATAEQLDAVSQWLDDNTHVAGSLCIHQESAECSTDGPAQMITLFAVERQEDLEPFLTLRHRNDHSQVHMADDGVVITEKLSELLGVQVGDTITLDADSRVEAKVVDITENYVQHYIYVTAAGYETLFGQQANPNAFLVSYAPGVGQAESDQVSEHLMTMEAVTSYSYIATFRDTLVQSMDAINYAVIIVIVSAAILAFVVLYNLTNINITERMRELATLKVLGFYDREVSAYVYRENIFLTLFGIALGLVLGRYLHSWLVLTVEVDRVMFGRTAPAYAYLAAAALTVVFSALVNLVAHFHLKKVDMVESLKSVE